MKTSIQDLIDTRTFNYYFKVGDEVQVDENIILNESSTCNLVKDHIGKKGIVRGCHSDLHAYGRGSSYSMDVEFDGVLVKNIWAPLLVSYKRGGSPQDPANRVKITEREIEKIGYDHDRDSIDIIEERKGSRIRKILCLLNIHRWIEILPTRTNRQRRCIYCNTTREFKGNMTNERKAVIGSIIGMIYILLCFIIKPMGIATIWTILGLFLLSVMAFVIWWIFIVLYNIILETLEYLDKRKENKG